MTIDYELETRKHGSQAKAAKALGLNKRTFERRLKKQRSSPRVSIPKLRIKAYKQIVNLPVKRFFVMADSHSEPGLPPDRFKHMGYWAKKYNFDYVIHCGDIVDFESLCTHVPNDTWTGKFKGTLADDLSALKRDLDAFNGESGGIPVQGVMGNHCNRPWAFANRNPEVYHFLQHAFTEILEKSGWNLLTYGERLTVEGVDFIHTPMSPGSDKKPLGGETIMQRYAKRVTRSVCFGHNHKQGVYTEYKDGGDKVTLINLPCSYPQGHLPLYTKGTPTGWSYGIYELTVLNGDIIGHRFVSMIELQMEYEREK